MHQCRNSRGIQQFVTTSGTNQTITGNTVYNLSNTHPTASLVVIGIDYTGPTSGTNVVSGNFIYGLSATSSNILCEIDGILLGNGVTTVANNIINLGTSVTTGYKIYGINDNSSASTTNNNSLYFNSIYLAGTVSSPITSPTAALWNTNTTAVRNYRNNILMNVRTGGSTGKHYAIRTAGAAGLTIDYNDYYVTGGAFLGSFNGGSDKTTLADWKTATGQDANSLSTNPLFTNAGSTNPLNYYTSAILAGATGTGTTTDFTGLARSATPKMGALEISSYVWSGATSTSFATATNWLNGQVPPNGSDISFAASPFNNCILDQNRTLKNITNAQATYKLLLNGNQLTLLGNLIFSNNAKLDATASSSVLVFGGTASQNILSGALVSNTMKGFTLNNSNGVSLNDDITIGQALTLTNGTLSIGAHTLTLSGTITSTVGTIAGGNTSNLVINGAVSPTLRFDQSTLGTTNVLNNLTIATTSLNTTTIGNPVIINGTLSTSALQILNLGTNALTGTLTGITNNGIIATQNTTSLPIPTGKTWGGTINYNAAAAQQTVVIGTYNNLTVSTTGGAIAAGSLSVNGILDLPASNPSSTVGSLSVSSYTLAMGANATNTGIGDVTGIVTRNNIVINTSYTLGNPYTFIVFPANGTLPTTISLKTTIGATPTWKTGAIKRVYDFIQTGGSGTKGVLKLHYLDSELNGNVETKLVDWTYNVASATSLEQGRANYNATDNWVELTNINVALYFSSSFGAAALTLDESEAGSLTWNGSVNDSWTNPANWTPNATPSDNTIVNIPDAATTPNDPLVSSVIALGTLNIEAGGIVNAAANSQFTINNGVGAWINNGTYNPGTGTSNVIFTSAVATMGGTTTFNNITINAGSTLRPMSNCITRISGQFTINGALLSGAMENTIEFTGSGQTIPIPNGTSLNAYHHLVINGTGAIFPVSLNIKGDLTLNQAVDFTGKTIVMSGGISFSQFIKGTSNPVFNNLIIDNNNLDDVTLQTNATIVGTLTLTSGLFILDNDILKLGSNSVAGSFSASTMIVIKGNAALRRTYTGTGSYLFPIGESNNSIDYSPITVNLTAGTFSNAYVGVSVIDAIHPNNSSTANNLKRYWKVNQSGITGALATITANYVTSDVTGLESNIRGGQLNGTFNQANNPWIKYTALANNSFSASGAILTAGQTSVFTGLSGVPFSVVVSGFGSFCLNQSTALHAEVTGGDGPFTYLWSGGLGTSPTASPPTSSVGTMSYTVTVKDANGIMVSDTNTTTVVPDPVGGTLASNQIICAASTPANLTLSGQTGNVIYWQSASDADFSSPVYIDDTTTTLTGTSIGPLLETTYFRAVVQSGACRSEFSSVATISINTTTWDGTSWSNGVPNSATGVLITGNYTASANLNGCTLIVSNNAVVNIPSGFNVSLNGIITVEAGSTFTLENNANLLQVSDVANSGNIIVKRNSSPLLRLDYTLWSSPVDGQQLQAFSPLTLANRFYSYNSTTNLYAVVVPTVNFETAKGYLIRVPNSHPLTATAWNGVFTGVPHNGNYSYPMSVGDATHRFNLVGNPYPSPISMANFVSENSAKITGTLYFWRKTNNAASPSYCSWTAGTFVNNGEAEVVNPNGILRTGQGFFVEAKQSADAVTFTNTQRTSDTSNQFFRNSDEEEHNRIWLNAADTSGSFSQMEVGYVSNATQGLDDYDGKYINDGAIELYSLVDAEKLVIQGRALPFVENDVVPLGFKTSEAGMYTITLDHVDGLFLGNQAIFIKDNLTGAIHDIKSGPYSFTSEIGVFESRFEIIYTTPLANATIPQLENQVIAFKGNDKLIIKSGTIVLESVKVFDIRGRLLAEEKSINAKETHLNGKWANGVLTVRITSVDGNNVVKKVLW